jgi:hypothetical protein
VTTPSTGFFSSELNWLHTHLLLLVVVIVLVVGSVYGVESLIAKHDDTAAARYSAIAAGADKKNEEVQAALQSKVDTLAAMNQQQSAQVSVLIQSLAKRQVAETAIPKQVGSLTAAQVATQLGGAANGDDVVLPLPQAQVALSDVQLVPLLQKDKVDLQDAYNREVQIAANNVILYNDEHDALLSEQKSHKADNDANAAEIKKVKADARKSKLKWLGIGILIGFVGRGFAGF